MVNLVTYITTVKAKKSLSPVQINALMQ